MDASAATGRGPRHTSACAASSNLPTNQLTCLVNPLPCIAEVARVTHTNANALAKRVAQAVPDAERCRKASREGTSRCSKPEARDKPGLRYLARDTRR